MPLGSRLRPNYRILLVAVAAGAAVLALYAYPICRPLLQVDDSQMLLRSTTGEAAWDNLWLPANEHAMPLGRLTTWLLIRAAGRPTAIPFAAGLQGVLALLAAMGLLYLFVRRELGHPFYGLVAAALFGVSTVYQQAIFWFAASFVVLALDTLLLALLAAQRWRQTGRARHLALCTFWSALAPGWFALGVLAGPLCCLYLLPFFREGVGEWKSESERASSRSFTPSLFHSLTLSLVPIFGSLLFLLVSVPRTAEHIIHLEHYGDKTAFDAFKPLVGVVNSGRSLVENLALGTVGLSGIYLPGGVVVAALVALGAAAGWWWRRAPGQRLLVLGLVLIGSTYWLIYSSRADWGYVGVMNQCAWSRYHLFPQLGLALFIGGGLPRWQERWQLDPTGVLSKRQARWLLLLIGLLFVIQLPRGLLCHWPGQRSAAEELTLLWQDPQRWLERTWADWQNNPMRLEQRAVLERVEEMDARCRRHRIDAPTARAALGHLSMPGCDSRENVWALLRGSDDPLPWSEEEARRLLQEPPSGEP